MDTLPGDPPTDRPGGLLAGRYRLQRHLGTGAMGVVWLALDELLQRLVAVKQLRPEAVLDPDGSVESRQRAMREGRIAARLRHPHAVTVYDVAEHNGLPLLVMEYVPSRSLAAVIRERGPLAPPVVARIGAQAASALAAAHAAGIVHRDIKPGNLLLDENGGVKIADFGISHATGDVAVTQAGLLAGTPAYLAPEIARGQPPGASSDVFSLGSTLYAAVEGRPPFAADGGNALAVLQRVAAAELMPPRNAGPLTPVLMAMLSPDPARRPTAEHAGQALRGVAEGRTTGMPNAAFMPATQAVSPATQQIAAATRAMSLGSTLLDARPVPVEEPEVRRRWPLLLAAVACVAVVVAVGLTQLSGRGKTSNDNSAAGQPTATSTVTPLGAAALTRAVSAYYALLPGEPGVAWRRLGPQLREQGEAAYRGHWSTVTALTVITPPRLVATDTVAVVLRLTLDNGSTVRETHRLTLLRGKSGALINGDTVTQRVTVTPPRATEDRKDSGDGNGNGNGVGNGENRVKHGKHGRND